VRRTQLYLEDDLWQVLRARARGEGTTVSELVRQAARERYLGDLEKRKQAMRAFVGIWKARPELRDSEAYVRRLRRGTRMQRLRKP
jgi:predicted DNA-binding ribbon-helix-helix protein